MLRNKLAALLLAAAVLAVVAVPQLFAKENTAAQLIGNWEITHRPVDASGTPCPFLPESIEFYKDQTLVMSNLPGRPLPYKTELTAGETKAFEARSEGYKGKTLLLVKPVPQMDWLSTPMVYVYSVTKDGLNLTADGWEAATFKRIK